MSRSMSTQVLLTASVAGLASLAALAPPAPPKVATVPIAWMATNSDLIVVAQVGSVSGADGQRMASATPSQTWKGSAEQVVEFLASPTWTCDISTAIAGERVLLFLKADESGRLTILHSGRGRMPLRDVDGQQFATFFGDIRFPEGTVQKLEDSTKGTYDRGVELAQLKRLVDEAIEEARKVQAEAEAKGEGK